MKSFILSLSVLLSLPAFSAVFGVDNRISVRPGTMGYELSRSTAVAVLSANFEPTVAGMLRLNVDKLNEFFCPNVRFANQPSLSYACTGFLIAPDLLVTAGHCMVNTGETRNETKLHCEVFSWLFDYNETLNTENVSADNHYTCKEIIYAVKDEKAPFRDYALVRLSRPVKGRTPLKINSEMVKKNEIFSMIGHPFGQPAKYAHGARVVLNDPSRESFLTTLDAFEGNSGSPVFNAKNEVVGILVGGTPSANTLTNGRCEILNKCSEQGMNCLEPDTNTSIFPGYQGVGSEVQRIAPVILKIN
ncbi:MAG: serine protease [Bdellovibrionota bacterium]